MLYIELQSQKVLKMFRIGVAQNILNLHIFKSRVISNISPSLLPILRTYFFTLLVVCKRRK